MRARLNLDRIASLAIILAAICVALAAIDRMRAGYRTPADLAQFTMPSLERVDSDLWDEILRTGIRTGSPTAAVEVVEFVDLECTFCRRSHSAFQDAKEEFGDELAYIFVHYPLSTHRFARLSATGAECAREQGRFMEFVSSVFAAQDSLGLLSWEEVAHRSGVVNLDEFSLCLHSPAESPSIEAGRRLGDRVGVVATPTVMINRWRLARPPYENAVDIIRDILHQRAPYAVEEEG